MKLINFLKPTVDKILTATLVVIAVLIASSITDIVIEAFIPTDFEEALLNKPIMDVLEEDFEGWMVIGYKILAIQAGIYLVILYLTSCVIQTDIRNRKLWIIVILLFIFGFIGY